MATCRKLWLIGCFLITCLFNQLYADCQSAKRVQTDEIHLKNIDGTTFNNANLTKKLLAFVFLSPECPLCQNYSLVLNKLQTKYNTELDIVGVFPGKAYTATDFNAFKKKYTIGFTLLTDATNNLVKSVGAKITPEVFLLNAQHNIIYRGAIDNWVVSLGKQRYKATENYLDDAITATLNKTALPLQKTEAIGCFINDL